jgi:ATP-dependent Clp protease ATP-binding subunit ClpA
VPSLIPYDARARKALELTFREALRLGHDHVGTEHVLLGLLELDGAVPALVASGVDKATSETAVLSALREPAAAT